MTWFDTPQSMALACLLLTTTVYSADAHAGTASGAFSVTVAAVAANNSSCTTAYALGTGLLVRCTSGVFVNIAQVRTALAVPIVGRFVDVFYSATAEKRIAPASDDALFDDAVADTERGWNFNDQLHTVSLDTLPTPRRTVAQLRQRNREGTLTALQVSQAIGGAETVEMLITF